MDLRWWCCYVFEWPILWTNCFYCSSFHSFFHAHICTSLYAKLLQTFHHKNKQTKTILYQICIKKIEKKDELRIKIDDPSPEFWLKTRKNNQHLEVNKARNKACIFFVFALWCTLIHLFPKSIFLWVSDRKGLSTFYIGPIGRQTGCLLTQGVLSCFQLTKSKNCAEFPFNKRSLLNGNYVKKF